MLPSFNRKRNLISATFCCVPLIEYVLKIMNLKQLWKNILSKNDISVEKNDRSSLNVTHKKLNSIARWETLFLVFRCF